MRTLSPSWKETSFSVLCGGFHRCRPAWDKPADGLDQCYKLYFVTAGEACLRMDGQPDAPLRARHAYCIPGYRLVGQCCKRSMDVYWVHFVPDSLYLSFLMSRVPRVHQWKLASLAYWQSTYEDIPRLFEDPPHWLYCRAQAMLLHLVSRVLESYNFDHMAAVDPVFEQLRPAISFMDELLLENPPLAEIARAAHLAPNYFHRRFTETFGMTPLAYMLQRRLSMARQLLLCTNLTLEAVAARTGFHSPFYFSRMFKKHYRLSPAQFRTRRLP
jgi:AraC-like DNA-binding protein